MERNFPMTNGGICSAPHAAANRPSSGFVQHHAKQHRAKRVEAFPAAEARRLVGCRDGTSKHDGWLDLAGTERGALSSRPLSAGCGLRTCWGRSSVARRESAIRSTTNPRTRCRLTANGRLRSPLGLRYQWQPPRRHFGHLPSVGAVALFLRSRDSRFDEKCGARKPSREAPPPHTASGRAPFHGRQLHVGCQARAPAG
jgi:hypothetical protein